MIEGLKLTVTGVELRQLLDERIASHRKRAERWRGELERKPEESTEEAPVLPDEMCENEAEFHEWRVEVLEFMRARIAPAETYRLGQSDLEFGELLPVKPGSVEHSEYQERSALAFNVERLAKSVDRFPGGFMTSLDCGKIALESPEQEESHGR